MDVVHSGLRLFASILIEQVSGQVEKIGHTAQRKAGVFAAGGTGRWVTRRFLQLRGADFTEAGIAERRGLLAIHHGKQAPGLLSEGGSHSHPKRVVRLRDARPRAQAL